MPVDMYIGSEKTRRAVVASLFAFEHHPHGWRIPPAVLFMAANGVYISENIPLPKSFQPTVTPSPTPTEETAMIVLQRANALFLDAQFEAAILEYQAVVALEPMNDLAYARMVKPLILLRKYDEAVKAGRRAVKINDQRPENLGALAEAFNWTGEYPEALNLALDTPPSWIPN